MQKFGPKGPQSEDASIMHFESTRFSSGCGRIFVTGNGAFFEYTLGAVEHDRYEIYGVHLSDDIARQFGHVLVHSVGDMYKTLGVRKDVWLKKAKGTLTQRAECVLDIAAVFGWDKIDDTPNDCSGRELEIRWFEEFKQEGAVTTADLNDVPLIASELMLALHSVSPVKYWSFFSGHFPLVPPEALNDCRNVWWGQHGTDAVAKIVSALRDVCPANFEFSLRLGSWGFWKKGTLDHGPNTPRSPSA